MTMPLPPTSASTGRSALTGKESFVSSSISFARRLAVLEAADPMPGRGRPFLWPAGQSLDEALADAGLSLADKPLFATELDGAVCPLHERDG
jgi:hypothetical protein